MDTQQKIWPTEDYELARSLVDVPVPEEDLFTGIRSQVGVR
jgi:mycothiol S-conjugate amidase